jgi:L-malate glycosyltransferase
MESLPSSVVEGTRPIGRQMKITFVMPGYSAVPSGGLKVMYEYANRLAARGHNVTVVHPRLWDTSRFVKLGRHPLTKLRLWRGYLLSRLRDRLKREPIPAIGPMWYPLDSHIRQIVVPQAKASCLPDGDAIGCWTGEILPASKGRQFVLVQGYGVFPKGSEDAGFRAPVIKVVIARWLYEQGLRLGIKPEEMVYIPNGIDHDKYRIMQAVETRPPRVAMIYSTARPKGSRYGIAALEMARQEYPGLKAVLFGVVPPPKDLPGWIEYRCNPPQEDLVGNIYNGSSMYMCSSVTEGFHLPPAEAMACGCAVVSTDIGGVRDYAEHGVTALLCPPRNPEALAGNLLRLLRDDSLRVAIAKAGYQRMNEFTWERSTDLLEGFLKQSAARPESPEGAR